MGVSVKGLLYKWALIACFCSVGFVYAESQFTAAVSDGAMVIKVNSIEWITFKPQAMPSNLIENYKLVFESPVSVVPNTGIVTEGVQVLIGENGTKYGELPVKNSKLNGQATISLDNLSYQIPFENDVLNGTLTVTELGTQKLIKKIIYKNNITSECLEYDEAQALKSRTTFDREGKILITQEFNKKGKVIKSHNRRKELDALAAKATAKAEKALKIAKSLTALNTYDDVVESLGQPSFSTYALSKFYGNGGQAKWGYCTFIFGKGDYVSFINCGSRFAKRF
jgi:hypothetical protein